MKKLALTTALLSLLFTAMAVEIQNNPNVPNQVSNQITMVVIDGLEMVGMIVDKKENLVLTCFHGKIAMPDVFVNGRPCTVLGIDADNDLMLLKVPDVKFIEQVKFSKDQHYPLDDVVIYGHPLIFKKMFFKRSIAGIHNNYYIVLDGSICHGHSGSPLYNKKWEVIGMIIGSIADVFKLQIMPGYYVDAKIPAMGIAADKNILQFFIKKHTEENEKK